MQAVNGLPTFSRRYAAKKWSCPRDLPETKPSNARTSFLSLMPMGFRLRLHPRLYAIACFAGSRSRTFQTASDAVYLHIKLMQLRGETRYGVSDRTLVESALARPHQAANYENVDILREAATLCFGLIKNHPWIGGNKRTATAIVDEFLFRNGYEVNASVREVVEMVLAVESDTWKVDELESWFRRHTSPKSF